MELYPLLMRPYFRHGEETPWGGSALGDWFGKEIPDDRTGESLEISALQGMESVVKNGPFAGRTLLEMIEMWGTALTGEINGPFPLLLKFLDARESLSVQVHPDDDYAMREGKLGKTEAWVILNAPEGARLAYGLDTRGRPLREIADAGELEGALRWVSARPGDVFYIRPGMVHAAGGNIQCYEIQQSSDATYRFWDWGRVGKDGKPRPLHMRQALDVSLPELHTPKARGVTVLRQGGSRTIYICNRHFSLSRLNLSGRMPLESGRMLFLTPTGPVRITWPSGEIVPRPFESILIPAKLEGVCLEGEENVLLSSLPDREQLRRELGYRAYDVAGLME